MRLFDRIASVTWGEAGTENGIRVNDLRIMFEVTKNLEAATNSGRVSIYNLNQDSHGKLKAGDIMILRAGYRQRESQAPIIALGAIRSVVRQRQDADLVSTITLEDGLLELRRARLSVTYPEGTAAADVLSDAIDALGLDAYELPTVDPAVEYVQGFAFEGQVRDLLSKVCSKLDLEWSVQTGKILIVPAGGTGMIEAVHLSAASGLIQMPEKLTEEPDELQAEAVRRPDGWRIHSLLRPEIVPGGTLSIESATVTGAFRIESVTHTGDTHGDDWTSVTTVRESVEAA